MGCVQAKSSMHSPLEKLKLENRYLKGGNGVRQINGQKYDVKEAGKAFRRPELVVEDNNNSNKYVGDGGVVNEATANGDYREIKVGSREGEQRDKSGSSGGGGGGSNSNSKRIVVKKIAADELVDGWPKWLVNNIPRDVLDGLVPKSADSYDKLAKVGQGTYSNVYKARDRETGKIVALKKVRFDTSETESVKFMAREIMTLRKLDHPNIIKLEGLATSRMQYSLYLVFDFMPTDLNKVISRIDGKLTEPQVKCYMQQLLSGLQHCHERGILHRDIKGSNLLIDKNGELKIADFGLANFFHPKPKRPLTSRVVTLWYRAPELLLGSNDYGVGIDLWSAGCLLAEMFVGRPILPGRTEVEQLHRIFKLCGTPSEDYWKKMKLPTSFRPPQDYKPTFQEYFANFPSSWFGLLTRLLALEPAYRGCATSALESDFFTSSPLACRLSGLPKTHKEEDEPAQASDWKKHKKMKKKKKRSQIKHEDHMENGLKAEEAKGEPSASIEEEKNSEQDMLSIEIRNSLSSNSLSVKRIGHEESPPHSPTPAALYSRRTRSFSRTEARPNVTKNIMNFPVQNSKSDFTNHDQSNISVLLQRSMSNLDFRTLDPEKINKLFGLEND